MRLPFMPFGSRPLSKQKPLMKGSDVRRLQQVLKYLGFFNARIDGVFGYDTFSAVKEFQRFFNIKSKGIVDEEDYSVLRELMAVGINKWHMIQRDYAHSGYSPVPVPIKLKKCWARRIPDIIGLNCSADRLIVTTRQEVISFDFKGSRLWKSKEIFPVAVSTISEGQVFVPAHQLTVLDIYSGKIQSNLKQDTFILPVTAKAGHIYAPSQGTLYAFNPKGSTIWQYKTAGAYCTSPAIGFDLIYFASFDKYIYCLDEKGLLYWKTKVSDIIENHLALWEGMVFAISRDSWIIALNPLTGKIIWQKKFFDEELKMPAFHKDFMLIVNNKGEASALSLQRAEIRWVVDLPSVPTTDPIICKDAFFVGTEEGLLAYDMRSLKFYKYLENKKISAVIPGNMGVFVATDQELIRLSRE